MTLCPCRCSAATTDEELSNRSMSYTFADTDWSTGVVSCHCHVVSGAGIQSLVVRALRVFRGWRYPEMASELIGAVVTSTAIVAMMIATRRRVSTRFSLVP